MDDIQHSSLSDVAKKRRLSLTVGSGKNSKKLYVRPLEPEEYDEARFLEEMTLKSTLARPEVADLKNKAISDEEQVRLETQLELAKVELAEIEPPADSDKDGETTEEDETTRDRRAAIQIRIAYIEFQLKTRTLADEMAEERSTLTRDRWLTARLLEYEDGKSVFDTTDADFEKQWRDFPTAVKDRIRPLIWQMLRRINDAPLPWES